MRAWTQTIHINFMDHAIEDVKGYVHSKTRKSYKARLIRYVLILLALATLTFGQSFEVKDRHGISVMTVNVIKMFRYSSYFKNDVADIKLSVKNTSGEWLENVGLRVIIHKKDGSKVERLLIVNACIDCNVKITEDFSVVPYTPEDFESVEFALQDWWQSPEDRRLAADAEAKKEAAAAARRRRLTAEQKRKDAELHARMAKALAEDEARAAEERRKTRAACAIIYKNTADKKLRDLTVKEDQQVRACQALDFYSP